MNKCSFWSLDQNHFSEQNASTEISERWLTPCLMPVGAEICKTDAYVELMGNEVWNISPCYSSMTISLMLSLSLHNSHQSGMKDSELYFLNLSAKCWNWIKLYNILWQFWSPSKNFDVNLFIDLHGRVRATYYKMDRKVKCDFKKKADPLRRYINSALSNTFSKYSWKLNKHSDHKHLVLTSFQNLISLMFENKIYQEYFC